MVGICTSISVRAFAEKGGCLCATLFVCLFVCVECTYVCVVHKKATSQPVNAI